MRSIPEARGGLDGNIVLEKDSKGADDSQRIAEAVRVARKADVIVLTVGEPAIYTGENSSRTRLNLTGNQQSLFEALAATGKPIVTVLFCGRPLNPSGVFARSSAVLFAWQPGVQAGPALTDVLSGEVSPQGHLAMTIPKEVGQLPLTYNRYHTGYHNGGHPSYIEGADEPEYWFGHGLSYTSFRYGPVTVVPRQTGKTAEAHVTLQNTGQREAEEVAQLYIRQNVCHVAARPEQELRGFVHVDLKPGESRQLSFALTPEVLGYTDRNGRWQVDQGDYTIWIAGESHAGEPVVLHWE